MSASTRASGRGAPSAMPGMSSPHAPSAPRATTATRTGERALSFRILLPRQGLSLESLEHVGDARPHESIRNLVHHELGKWRLDGHTSTVLDPRDRFVPFE